MEDEDFVQYNSGIDQEASSPPRIGRLTGIPLRSSTTRRKTTESPRLRREAPSLPTDSSPLNPKPSIRKPYNPNRPQSSRVPSSTTLKQQLAAALTADSSPEPSTTSTMSSNTNTMYQPPNIWASASYNPPQGPCLHKTSLLNPACACLRFMLHPLKAATSFVCDGCGHHACFHKMESTETQPAVQKENVAAGNGNGNGARFPGVKGFLQNNGFKEDSQNTGRAQIEGQKKAGPKKRKLPPVEILE